MKFDSFPRLPNKKFVAAAALAASECIACSPLMKADVASPHAVARAELQEEIPKTGLERLRNRFDLEVNSAEETCVKAPDAMKCFRDQSPHVQALVMQRFAETMQRGSIPVLLKKQAMDEAKGRISGANEADGNMVHLGHKPSLQRGESGQVERIFDVRMSEPASDMEAVHARSWYLDGFQHQIDGTQRSKAEFLSPMLLRGIGRKGEDVLAFYNGTTAQGAEKDFREEAEGIFRTKNGHRIRAIPGGIRIENITGKTVGDVFEHWCDAGGVRTTESFTQGTRYDVFHTLNGQKFALTRERSNQSELWVTSAELEIIFHGQKNVVNTYWDERNRVSLTTVSQDVLGNKTQSSVYFSQGLPAAETSKDGNSRFFSEQGIVGTWDEELKKNPQMTRSDFAQKLSKVVTSPNQWIAFAASYAESMKDEERKNPFRDSPQKFALFTAEILNLQGIRAAAVSVPGVGSGAVWAVNRGDGKIDVFAIRTNGQMEKNLHEISTAGISTLTSVPPFESIKSGFLAAAKKHSKLSEGSVSAIFEAWSTFSGMVEVLVQNPDGSVGTKKIPFQELVN